MIPPIKKPQDLFLLFASPFYRSMYMVSKASRTCIACENFGDPQWFQGTIYKAANWIYVGNTKGFRRTRQGYSAIAQSPKMVFVKPLKSNAQALLSRPILKPAYRTGGPKIMLSAQ